MPAGTLAPTPTVSTLVVEPSGGGVTVSGTNAQVTPAGWPLHANATALLNPSVEATVVVLVPLPPWGIVKDDGLTLTLKSGVEVAGGTAAKNTSCCEWSLFCLSLTRTRPSVQVA